MQQGGPAVEEFIREMYKQSSLFIKHACHEAGSPCTHPYHYNHCNLPPHLFGADCYEMVRRASASEGPCCSYSARPIGDVRKQT